MTTLNLSLMVSEMRYRIDFWGGIVEVKTSELADEAVDLEVQLWLLRCRLSVFGLEFNLITAAVGVLVEMICNAVFERGGEDGDAPQGWLQGRVYGSI